MRRIKFIFIPIVTCLVLCSLQVNAKRVPRFTNVILIGADGFTPEVITSNPGRYKNIEALMARGLWTFESRSVLPSSSAINWKTMLSGAGSEMHGYTEWNSQVPEVKPVYTDKWGMFPSVFAVVREQMPSAETGVIFSWEGIKYVYENDAVNYNDQCKEGDDYQVLKDAASYISAKKPNLLFVYFSNPDEVGHKYGWCSKEYNESCDTIDAYVGKLMAVIESNFDMSKTAVLFSSDHGGVDKGHGGNSMKEMQSPLIIVGGRLPKNVKMSFPVMRYDTAPTIIDLLGLKAPDEWRGKSVLKFVQTR
jgi:predicted AlkP superfamily pyrophosphatase or phosphodiesterase